MVDLLLRVVAEQFQALTAAEVVAVVTALGYLLLAIRRNIWCWFFAAVSTAIYIALFVRAKLYMESLLNGFYLVMAFYGWYAWYYGGDRKATLPVTKWSLRTHAAAIAVICLLSALSGLLLDRYSDAAYPYVDSMTAFSAIWATFLVARKVLENWWYWLVIDSVSVFLYWARDLQLTALLFVFYVVLIPIGLVAWTRAYAAQQNAAT